MKYLKRPDFIIAFWILLLCIIFEDQITGFFVFFVDKICSFSTSSNFPIGSVLFCTACGILAIVFRSINSKRNIQL